MEKRVVLVAAMLCLASFGGVESVLSGEASAAEPLPKVWMSTTWREPAEDTIRLCAEQGVDAVEVPTYNKELCGRQLPLLRKYKVKGFTSSGADTSMDVREVVKYGRPCERAVFTGGAYRGLAIDRTLFSFTAAPHEILVEPPVYSVRQPYTRRTKGADGKDVVTRSGHYFGSFRPTGLAEIIVPERLFDGAPHVRIIPCEVLPAGPDAKPENDTAAGLGGPEIADRRLVRLKFDLTDCADLMLDKVGIAVYWESDPDGKGWKNGKGQLSVFSKLTADAARTQGKWRTEQWALANGGVFPTNEIIAIRFGDECFNLTGWLDCAAASFPVWGFSPSGRAAFAAAAPGLVQPRTWGYPEIYGAEAYGHALYEFHRGCANLARAFAEGAHSVSPTLKVFRNTTRGDAWSEQNDHDGSGQELLARELDFIHLDPYPLGKKYIEECIPFDMGYMSGFARRFGKPIIPWMQGHSYAPCGLANVTPADMKRMWAQHLPFAPDGMMWLGFDLKPGKTDTEMTFPKGSPESWAYAKELFAEVHAAPPVRKPVATLAVLRPYSVRAACCAQGVGWAAWRNPADRILAEYVKAWSIDNGLFYDVFELPPKMDAAERDALAKELKKYPHVVSTHPYPGARIIGAGTEGTVMKAAEIAALRKKFASEIAELKARPVESFAAAKPVWMAGEERATNSFCAIRCNFKGDSGAAALRVTAAYDYRVRLNGRFVGFGPVRAPEGVFRIDEWKLDARKGDNVVEIEAAGYNCNSYYFVNQPAFVQAEVLMDGKVIAATGADGAFVAFDAGRICKVPRFSGQRTFIDAWRVGEMGGPRFVAASNGTPPQQQCCAAPRLAVQPMKRYEPRPVPYPDFAVNRSFRPIRKERLTKDPSRKIQRWNFIDSKDDPLHTRFHLDELETNPYYDLQGFARTPIDGDARTLASGESATFEGDRNVSGFIGLKVRTTGPCRIVLSWDEILGKDGVLNYSRLGCAAVAEWRIASAGEYELETFEPYAAKFIDVAVLEGKAAVDSVWVRTYVSPLADRTSFRASDPALERIFLAARESYRANAVDGFTDCPTRERAYWTGDTFFTGRASAWLSGDGSVERTFLANFLLADGFDWSRYNSKGVSMDGAIPALYPGGIFWDNFIPNYMMWTVMQLEEHVARYGDRDFADKCKRAVLGIVRFLHKFRNSDGLLEKLPGWVFVEWSKANELVQDVNYPSNMMYARMLEACANLYRMPELAAEAKKVRAEVVRQSWNGEWFCDNAVRHSDGSLKLSGECTETCQYCAFFFGTVTPESHPALWKRMLDEFGPDRVAKGVHKRIWPANFIFGTCERLELLSRAGRSRQILDETRDWFLTMADRTGTLWEHLNTKGNCSCCHGFASIASEYLFRDVLGVREIDRTTKVIRVSPSADLPLEWCEGTLPLSRDEVAVVKWRKTSDGLKVDVKLPTGWTRSK